MSSLFQESQRFRQNWLWFTIAAISVTSLSYLAYIQEFDAVMILVPVFGLTFALFDLAKLKTEVVEDGIQIRFFPFHISERKIKFSDIEEFGAEEYSPLIEFGGWGIRWRTGRMAYNVSGNKAVRIIKQNGKQVVIGTQRPDEFEEAVRKATN